MGRGQTKKSKAQLKAARVKYPMTITIETFESWQKFKKGGDTTDIAKEIDVSIPTASRMLEYGFVSKNNRDKVQIINNFFTERFKKEQEQAKELIELAKIKKSN